MTVLANQASYTEKTYKTDDGLTLEYRDYLPLRNTKTIPVICLHGLTRNLHDFEGGGAANRGPRIPNNRPVPRGGAASQSMTTTPNATIPLNTRQI